MLDVNLILCRLTLCKYGGEVTSKKFVIAKESDYWIAEFGRYELYIIPRSSRCFHEV